MSIVHKQISPVGPTGIAQETWDTYRLMRHLELIGPDKHLGEHKPGVWFASSDERKEYKRKVDQTVFVKTEYGEALREVPGHRHYYATEDGDIYSGRSGKLKKMKLHNGKYVSIMGRQGNQVNVSAITLTNMAWE